MKHLVKVIKDFPPTTEYKYDEDRWNQQHGDAFVIINCRAADIYYPEHWTPFSIKCAFNGKEFYKLKNTTYAVTDTNFLVLNQGCEYASYILSDSVTESFTLNFTPYNLSVLLGVYGRDSLQLLDNPFQFNKNGATFFEKLYPYNATLASCIVQVKKLIAARQVDSLAITEILYGILEEIILLNSSSIKEADRIMAKKRATRLELYRRLNIVKDYLASCYHEEITLERMAETCYLNPFHLLREFKKLYGITPHQYLTRIRLQEAEKLISCSKSPINNVVQEIGFQDSTSFNRLFKKYYGISPSIYRNTMRE